MNEDKFKFIWDYIDKSIVENFNKNHAIQLNSGYDVWDCLINEELSKFAHVDDVSRYTDKIQNKGNNL